MKEAYIESRLREGVKSLGGMAVKFPATYLNGFPDRIVLMPGGRIWFVETKAPKRTPSKLQNAVHGFLERLGFEVLVIDTTTKVKEFLQRIAE